MRGTGDLEVLRVAERQHGHVHRRQLIAAGIGREALAHRLRTGRLHRALPSVYLVGRPRPTRLGRIMAAVLHLKGDGAASHRAAAYVWGLLDATQEPDEAAFVVDVLVVGRSARADGGLRIHRSTTLARQDVRRRDGIPVTSPGRTILDLAAMMNDLELASLLSAAVRRQLVRRSELDDVVARNPRAKGVALLRTLLAQENELRDTRSKYERRLLELVRAAELPMPRTNVVIAGQMVDALWPELKLVLEVDGWRHHRDAFERDRTRDQHLMIAGHHVVRTTRRQIDFQPYALVARLAAMITTLRLAQQAGSGGAAA